MKKLLLLVFLCFPFALVAQNTGVGTSNPLEFFSVGASSQFRVNASGNIVRINDVAYSFPASQATTGSLLANDGTGNLTWTKVTTGNISATGTPSSSTYLRGDGAWASAGGGSSLPSTVFVTTTSFTPVSTTTIVTVYSTTISVSGTYLLSIGYVVDGDYSCFPLYIYEENNIPVGGQIVADWLTYYHPNYSHRTAMLQLSQNNTFVIKVSANQSSPPCGPFVAKFQMVRIE